MVDGLGVTGSYNPGTTGADSATAYALSYTGVEGLSVAYGKGNGSSPSVDLDVTTLDVSYAMGSFTVGYSKTDYDSATALADKETTGMGITYTVSDELSITYGADKIEADATAATQDAEFDALSVAYTAGGMTISAAMKNADNIDGTTTATEDREMWSLGASFAF